MRPQVPIKFDDILAMSAKNEPESVEIVKKRIRDLLDCYAELNEKPENAVNASMYTKMTDLVAERGPKVI